MGHHHSKPDKQPGCRGSHSAFHDSFECIFPPPAVPVVNVTVPQQPQVPGNGSSGYFPSPIGSEYGKTSLRLFIGSHETKKMGGSIPGIAIFDEFGARIGQYKSTGKTSAAGGFKDIDLELTEEHQGVRPSYMLLHAGEEPICISALAIGFPDGVKQLFAGSDLDKCGQIPLSDSKTYVGPYSAQPQCFWLRPGKDSAKAPIRLSFHIPDFIYSKARDQAYTDNKDLVCRQTPRFFTSSDEHNSPDLESPIPIFNPLIEYDTETQFDKYPNRVLDWKLDPTDPLHDYSDISWVSRPPYTQQKKIRGLSHRHDGGVHKPTITESEMVAFVGGQIEKEQVRTEAPKLVISEKDISAVKQCRLRKSAHTDYVSLSEQIYCDMQGGFMYPLCRGDISQNCYDMTTKKLRGLETPESSKDVFEGLAVASLGGPWTATGPLFGFAYHNITTIG